MEHIKFILFLLSAAYTKRCYKDIYGASQPVALRIQNTTQKFQKRSIYTDDTKNSIAVSSKTHIIFNTDKIYGKRAAFIDLAPSSSLSG
jgi:hypothetical protein